MVLIFLLLPFFDQTNDHSDAYLQFLTGSICLAVQPFMIDIFYNLYFLLLFSLKRTICVFLSKFDSPGFDVIFAPPSISPRNSRFSCLVMG